MTNFIRNNQLIFTQTVLHRAWHTT